MRKFGIILVSGKMYSGKDTAALIIQKLLAKNNINARIDAFAIKLKQVVSLMSNVPMGQIMGKNGKQIFVPEFNITIGFFFKL